MAVEIITREDLNQFKHELISEIKALLGGKQQAAAKQWYKSWEVRQQLGISPGTLQNLRVNGTLQYTKIGGIMYYKAEDIQKLLEAGRKEVKR